MKTDTLVLLHKEEESATKSELQDTPLGSQSETSQICPSH